MAYLCVDEDGQEMIFDNKPYRDTSSVGGYWNRYKEGDFCNVDLPKGAIKKLIGKDLTWEDEPYEFTEQDNINIKPVEKKKFNWKIMLLSVIWSLILICISNFAMGLGGYIKLIVIVLITIVTSFVFYFGYKDVNITDTENK
jgi:hypothetical protein